MGNSNKLYWLICKYIYHIFIKLKFGDHREINYAGNSKILLKSLSSWTHFEKKIATCIKHWFLTISVEYKNYQMNGSDLISILRN